jgi:hypothetical protein
MMEWLLSQQIRLKWLIIFVLEKDIGLVRLAGGWWLRLIYCERKILLAGGWC